MPASISPSYSNTSTYKVAFELIPFCDEFLEEVVGHAKLLSA
jgi:hypothetical protein